MSTTEEFLRCKAMSRAQFRASGGCTWERQENSPGFTLRIPSGTRFKIRTEGPQSHKLISGVCRAGHFEIVEGDGAGFYKSANEAVTKARPNVLASNAYLYVEFGINGCWKLADQLRYDERIGIPDDEVEAEALEILKPKCAKKLRLGQQLLTAESILISAERALDNNPRARELAAAIVQAKRKAIEDF